MTDTHPTPPAPPAANNLQAGPVVLRDDSTQAPQAPAAVVVTLNIHNGQHGQENNHG